MRIGLSLTPTTTVGVAVSHGGVITQRLSPARGTVGGSVGRVLRGLLSSATPAPGEVLRVIVDVSAVLRPDRQERTTVLRIAPRRPVDEAHWAAHELGQAFPMAVFHAAGGHTILGEELVPLDVEAIVQQAGRSPRGCRYVITAVGSRVNPAHELRAGQILLDHVEPASIEYGHRFANGAIAVRERTALTNSSLLGRAEGLGTSLALTVGRVVPRARVFVTTNDGGCTPLARLSLTPVHSMYAGSPTELIGAAALALVDEGRFILSSVNGSLVGEIREGVPAVVPVYQDADGRRIATQWANLRPAPADSMPILSEWDLRAVGAACAPLSDWVVRLINVNNVTEMNQALAAARTRVSARLVSFGASPSQTRILESRVIATAYQHPRVVSVQVRGVAGDSTAAVLEGESGETSRG